jgi:hypothetical protein
MWDCQVTKEQLVNPLNVLESAKQSYPKNKIDIKFVRHIEILKKLILELEIELGKLKIEKQTRDVKTQDNRNVILKE